MPPSVSSTTRSSVLPLASFLDLDDLLNMAAESFEQRITLLFVARIRQQGGDERCATGRQRSPRGPDVQRRDVPVSHVLLVNGIERGLFEWEGDFNESGLISQI